MMSLLRRLLKRFWLCLGLLMVIAGGTAATMGYLAAREAATMPTLVAGAGVVESSKTQPTTRKSTAGATTRKAGGRSVAAAPTTRKSGGSSSVASASRKPAAAAPATRSSSIIANANVPASGLGKWRGMMWWGGGVLAVGMVSVAYSIHEMRPKAPPTGADELLNDAPPF